MAINIKYGIPLDTAPFEMLHINDLRQLYRAYAWSICFTVRGFNPYVENILDYTNTPRTPAGYCAAAAAVAAEWLENEKRMAEMGVYID